MSDVKSKYEPVHITMRTKDPDNAPISTHKLHQFNKTADLNGFPPKNVCYGKSSNSPRPGICPKTVVSYLPREGICSIKEHGLPAVNYRLPLVIGTSCCPWISVKAVFQSIIRVSTNVHCLQFRDGVKQVGLLIDSQTKDIVGVMDLNFHAEERRIVVTQVVVSSNQEYIGVICQLNCNQRLRNYKIFIVGSTDVDNNTDSISHTMNSSSKVRIFDRVKFSHNNIVAIAEHSFRMTFVPSFTTAHYILLNIRNWEPGNGKDVHVAKVSMVHKIVERSLVDTMDLGFGCRSRVLNIVFGQDGAIAIVCLQRVIRTDDCEHFDHVILSTDTLQILQLLCHVLTIDFCRSINPLACFLNATPSVRYDGRQIGVIYSSKEDYKYIGLHDDQRNLTALGECMSNNIYMERPTDRISGDSYSTLMVNIYSLPLILLSLRSLTKLVIKMSVGNDPQKIRQLPIVSVLQEYIYDC